MSPRDRQALFDELCTGARIRGQNGEALTAGQVSLAVDNGWWGVVVQSWRQGRDLRTKVAS